MTKSNYTATMLLPTGTKEYWSSIMSCEAELDCTYYEGDIIVSADAQFEDGTKVIGGVRKSNSEDFNIKFFTVLDSSGKAYSSGTIDCSDHEDFRHSSYTFILNDDESIEYLLVIEEQ